MKGTKMQKGITLIALIITIIVLLVLAMVAIAAIQDSGILTHADRSAIMHEVGVISEKIRLESQALKLAGAASPDNAQKQNVENALTNLHGAAPRKVQLESATSIPETIDLTEEYYIVIPEKLNYDIIRGGKYNDNPITGDVFVVDEDFNVYYLTEATEKTVTPPGGGNPPEEPQIGALPDDDNIGTIRAIEDLVDLAIAVNAGTFEAQYKEDNPESTEIVVKLETTLDFEAQGSYRTPNPETTKYIKNGVEIDANGDGGEPQPIKKELTEGVGFTPIGTMNQNGMTAFKGTFEGNNNTLYNIHMNRTNDFAVGLFGIVDNDITVQNLKITGNITGNSEQGIAAGIIGINYSESGGEINISNCDVSDMNFSAAGVSGILGMVMSNTNITITDCEIANSCTFPDNIAGGAGICAIGSGNNNNITIKRCINNVDISGREVAGIVVNGGEGYLNNVTIEDCKNNGKISGIGTSSEDVNISGIASLYDDCFVNGNIRIVGCTNNGELTTSYGPVAGILNGGSPSGEEESIIDSCVNNGDILVSGDVWTISGIATTGGYKLVINNCTNNGSIEAKDLEYIGEVAGIIIGYAKEIKGCTNNGAISVGNRISKLGGVCVFTASAEEDINIEDCKNTGVITIVTENEFKNGLEYSGRVAGLGYIKNDGNVKIKNCTNEADITANYDFKIPEDNRYKQEAIITGVTACDIRNEGLIVELENLVNSGNISTNGHIVSGVFYGKADTLIAKQCENTGNVTTTHSEGKAYGVIGGTITNKTETDCENTGTITPASE